MQSNKAQMIAYQIQAWLSSTGRANYNAADPNPNLMVRTRKGGNWTPYTQPK